MSHLQLHAPPADGTARRATAPRRGMALPVAIFAIVERLRRT